MTDAPEPDDGPPVHPILFAGVLVLLCLFSAGTGYMLCKLQYLDAKCILRHGNMEIEVR